VRNYSTGKHFGEWNQTEKKAKDLAQEPKVIRVRIQKGKPEPTSTLFTSKEVRRFVTEFVLSWIRGDIIIRFPTATELSKKNPLAIAFPTDPSVKEELKIKEHYIDLLLICAGAKPASAEEQDKAVTEVFRMLLMFRSANRIEGKILSNDLEKRIATLEDKQRATTGLINQITGFLFKEKKPEP
jgi:hypothetical protein